MPHVHRIRSIYGQEKDFAGSVSRQNLKKQEAAVKARERLRQERLTTQELELIVEGVPILRDIYLENQVDADFSQPTLDRNKVRGKMPGARALKPELAAELKSYVAENRGKRELADFYPQENENFASSMKEALISRLAQIQSDTRALGEMHNILKALEKIAHRDSSKTLSPKSSEPLSEKKFRLFQQLDELSTAYAQKTELGSGEKILKVLSLLSALDEQWQKLSLSEQKLEEQKFKTLFHESKKAQKAFKDSERDGSLPAHEKIARKAHSGQMAFAFTDNKGLFNARTHSISDNIGVAAPPTQEVLSHRAQQMGLFTQQHNLSNKQIRIGKRP